jgi:hypothetical protein
MINGLEWLKKPKIGWKKILPKFHSVNLKLLLSKTQNEFELIIATTNYNSIFK